jgi:hypothetical protein
MNPHKGDVSFEVNGKTYTLRYSHLALVKLENVLNKGLAQILSELSKPGDMRLGTVLALLWAGLQKHHPGLSEEDASEILDDVEGGIATVMVSIDSAFSKAFGTSPGTKGTNPPQKEVNGSGMTSSSSLSATAMIQKPFGISPHEN